MKEKESFKETAIHTFEEKLHLRGRMRNKGQRKNIQKSEKNQGN